MRCIGALGIAVITAVGVVACTPEPVPASWAGRDDPVAERLALLDDLASELETAVETDTSPDAPIDALASWLDEHGARYRALVETLDTVTDGEIAMRMVRHARVVFELTRRMSTLRATIETRLGNDSTRLRRFRSLARQLDA